MKQPTAEQYQQAKDTIEKLGDQLEHNISVHLALMKRFTALTMEYAKSSDEHEGTMRALVAGNKILRQKEQVIADYKEVTRNTAITLNASKQEVESLSDQLSAARGVINKQQRNLQLLREQQSLTIRNLNLKPIPKTATPSEK